MKDVRAFKGPPQRMRWIGEAAMSERVSLKEITELVVDRRLWNRPGGQERRPHDQDKHAYPEPTSSFAARQRSKPTLKAPPKIAPAGRGDVRHGVENANQQNGIEELELVGPHVTKARFLSSTMIVQILLTVCLARF
jgi:hypothetical protein